MAKISIPASKYNEWIKEDMAKRAKAKTPSDKARYTRAIKAGQRGMEMVKNTARKERLDKVVKVIKGTVKSVGKIAARNPVVTAGLAGAAAIKYASKKANEAIDYEGSKENMDRYNQLNAAIKKSGPWKQVKKKAQQARDDAAWEEKKKMQKSTDYSKWK